MDNRKKEINNTIIMVAPILLPAILFLIMLGESFPLFLVPLVFCILMILKLATILSTKDAISYCFIQYPFLVLSFILLNFFPVGLEFILIFPMTFILNMVIGYLYFRFAKNKRWFTKILILLVTLVATVAIHPTPTIAFPPEIEYGEFPFHVVYKIDGVTYEIEDTVVVRYGGIGPNGRWWATSLESSGAEVRVYGSRIDIFSDTNVPSAFTSGRMNEKVDIWISRGSGAYYMGDRRGSTKPQIMYTETYRMWQGGRNVVSREITINELLKHFGIEMITWSFSEPVKNKFRP